MQIPEGVHLIEPLLHSRFVLIFDSWQRQLFIYCRTLAPLLVVLGELPFVDFGVALHLREFGRFSVGFSVHPYLGALLVVPLLEEHELWLICL